MNAHNAIEAQELPSNLEAEQALLGAILMDIRAYERVILFLEPVHFSEPVHRDIFTVIGECIAKGRPVNPITIKPYLPDVDLGEITLAQYLVRLASDAVSVDLARSFGEAIYEMWQRRELLETCDQVSERARHLEASDDILDAVSDIEDRLSAIKVSRLEQENSQSVADKWIDNIGRAAEKKDPVGVPIKHPELQKVLGEPTFQPKNLYGGLASSGEGKTSFVLELMDHALKNDHPVLFLSYDQSTEQCIAQMAQQALSIDMRRQLEGDLSGKEIGWCVDFKVQLNRRRFEIIECSAEKADRLVTLARSFIRRYGNGKTPLIVIDHIKAIPVFDKRTDAGTQATDITRVLKSGAKELDAAFLILNQRNSAGNRRDIPQPLVGDIHGGEIARTDYDAIFYLYRYKKWHDERRAIATQQDQKKLEWAFKYYLSQGGVDITKIGAVKVRFGNPAIFKHMEFEAQFTRYKKYIPFDAQPEAAQEGLNI